MPASAEHGNCHGHDGCGCDDGRLAGHQRHFREKRRTEHLLARHFQSAQRHTSYAHQIKPSPSARKRRASSVVRMRLSVNVNASGGATLAVHVL